MKKHKQSFSYSINRNSKLFYSVIQLLSYSVIQLFITLNCSAQQIPLKGVVTNSKTCSEETQYVKNSEVRIGNRDVILNETFATPTLPAGWTNLDVDGDGYTWQFIQTNISCADIYPEGHNDTYCINSGSYYNCIGALHPDNWLISPQFSLAGLSQLTYWVKILDTSYPTEHYGVYISTIGSTNPTDFSLLFEETLTSSQASWTQRAIDIFQESATCRIAFRHFNCYDKYILFLDDVMVTGSPTPCNDVICGTGTSYYYDPLPGWYGWNRNIMLFEASELNGAGDITEIAFDISGTSAPDRPMSIYLMHTDAATLDAQYVWNTIKAQATLVYDGTPGFPTTGWETFTLDNSFAYNGTQNLLVLVEGTGCTPGSGGCAAQCRYSTKTNCHWYSRTDTNPPDDAGLAGSRNSNRPNITFKVCQNTTISGAVFHKNHTPVDADTVKLYLITADHYILKESVPVASDGSYTFTNVADGDYVVKVFPDISENLLPHYYGYDGSVEFCSEATEIKIEDHTSVENIDILIPIPLPPLEQGTSLIYGYVGNIENGKGIDRPISDVGTSLQAQRRSSWETVAFVNTDEEGYFEFGDLPAGLYKVIIDIPCLEINSRSTPEIVINERDTAYLEFIVTEDEIIITGINSFTQDETQIRVYPNPTTGELTIEMGDMRYETCDIAIYDIFGRKVQVSNPKSQVSSLKIDISHLPAGVYFLRVYGRDAINRGCAVKFIKR